MNLFQSRMGLDLATCIVVLVGLIVTGCSSDSTSSGWSFDDDVPSGHVPSCDEVMPERATISPDDGNAVRQSLELGPTGCPHLAFMHEASDGDERIQYASWDGRDWQVEVVAQVGPSSSANDLAVDDEGQPSMAYTVNEGERLMYARRDESGQWHSEKVADLYVRTLEHDVDPEGRPVIAAVVHPSRSATDESSIIYFYRDAGDWRQDEVLVTRQFISTPQQIVFDSQGRPHLATMISGSRALYTFRTGDASWQQEHIELERPRPLIVYLALDGDEQPHLVSCGLDTGIEHLYRQNGAWQREQISELGESGYFCGGIAVDTQNRLHTLYGPNSADRDREPFFHASFDGDGWTERPLGETVRGTFQVDARRDVIHVLALAEPSSPDNNVRLHEHRVIYLNFPLDTQ